MALSDSDVDRIAKAVWKYKISDDHDAGWHLRVVYKISRWHLGNGGGPEPFEPPAAEDTIIRKIWDAVKPAGATKSPVAADDE